MLMNLIYHRPPWIFCRIKFRSNQSILRGLPAVTPRFKGHCGMAKTPFLTECSHCGFVSEKASNTSPVVVKQTSSAMWYEL